MSENDIGILPTPLLLKRRAAELLAEAAATEEAAASDALVRLAQTLLAYASRLQMDAAEPARTEEGRPDAPPDTVGTDPRPKPSE